MLYERKTIKDLIRELYLDLNDLVSFMSESRIRQYFSQCVILIARNIDVNFINNVVLQRLSENFKVYVSADSAFNDADVLNNEIFIEYLNTISVSDMLLHEITLKINCLII